MAKAFDTRLPFPIPFGWFRIGARDELAPGELARHRYFGRELIWWRDRDGRDSLVDASCPHLGAHLGAHLGHGGRVEGDRLVCPFHGWRFDPTGSCVAIPHAKRVPSGVCLRSYPIRVLGPFVLAWFHPRGEAPHFELPNVPVLDDPAYASWRPVTFDIATHPQELAENAYDPAHFFGRRRGPGLRSADADRRRADADAFQLRCPQSQAGPEECFRERAPLVESEAGIPRFRKWYQRFYAGAPASRSAAQGA